MSKVRNPVTFCEHFAVDPDRLDRLGVVNPTLAIDTKLFIDPLLLPESQQPEMRDLASSDYCEHFERIITFLSRTQREEDVAWRTARHMLEFHEIKGTCLGYGAGSISGSGFGPELTERILRVGKEIVDLGITDPDLFPSMAIFEADIGPDRISDMVTNVVRNSLILFNQRILQDLHLEGEEFDLLGSTGYLLANPYQRTRTPIILVPQDILRKLPIALDWDDIADAASENDALRNRVNKHIGHIWAIKTKREKEKLRQEALANREAFQTLLDAIHGVPPRAYNSTLDPDGLLKWAQVARDYTQQYPLRLRPASKTLDLEGAFKLVQEIVVRFRQLIENNGLNRELYKANGKPRHESTPQRLFFAVAYCYCEANNLDISPEVDSGNGQVDFKFSTGFDSRVLVEIKLSTNGKLVSGYTKQLETYKAAEQTMRAIYLVLDVGNMGKKDEKLVQARNAAFKAGYPVSEIEFVDGIIRQSASRR
ncbi:MAG: hypothetical protein WCU00_08345 [Candidatus Latescibacterota bacterium]